MQDLSLDAERDLRDIDCHVNVIRNLQSLDRELKATGLSKDFQEGKASLPALVRESSIGLSCISCPCKYWWL